LRHRFRFDALSRGSSEQLLALGLKASALEVVHSGQASLAGFRRYITASLVSILSFMTLGMVGLGLQNQLTYLQ